jgi:hypothetical protein
VNLTELSTQELMAHAETVRAEIARRRVLASAEQQVKDLNERYLEAEGAVRGQAWKAPTGAHNAYPQGWQVLHLGKRWESLLAANVWEPGTSGWREIVPDTPVPTVPAFLQPTGAHDAYKIGDLVLFQGQVYESTINGNVWSPAAYPAGWKLATVGPAGLKPV